LPGGTDYLGIKSIGLRWWNAAGKTILNKVKRFKTILKITPMNGIRGQTG
jgi:hypothetical protein